MPKVSVIIPTYNRVNLLHSAITSVLNQTFQDFEILVIDDGSQDNTQEVVGNFHDTRVHYIRHKKNKGEAEARNTGIINSHAEYIAFLDDDDEWMPEKLRLQVDLFENSEPRVGCIYTGYLVVDTTKKKILRQRIPIKRGNIYHDIFVRNYIGIPSTVILKRECFQKVNLFDKNIAFGTDYDMWIRIAKEFHFDYIEKPLVKYCVHKNRLSTNLEIQIKGFETILKKYDQFFTLNNKIYCHHYIYLGLLYCCIGNFKKGREVFLKTIRLRPFGIKSYLSLGLSFFSTSNFRRIRNLIEKFLLYRKNQDTF